MRCVFTGPPCSGKSSVFKKLQFWDFDENFAFRFVDEVARESLKFFTEHEPDKLPWNNREFFQNYIETIQLQNFFLGSYSFEKDIPTIFDRCLVDEIGYRNFFGMKVPETLTDKIARYRYDKIFYFPLWEEIYTKDSQRIEPIEEAKLIETNIRSAYINSGYELIEVPKVSVEERVKFIYEQLK